MNELIAILQTFTFGELDDALADFVASAGILVSQVDGKSEKREEEYIIKELAQFTLFPYKVMKQVEKGDVVKIFEDSFSKILEIATPEDEITPLNYILEIVVADNYLDDREMTVVYDLGRKMGLTDYQISKEIALKLREKFQPRATALK
jgi:nitrogen regulatory protein PII